MLRYGFDDGGNVINKNIEWDKYKDVNGDVIFNFTKNEDFMFFFTILAY